MKIGITQKLLLGIIIPLVLVQCVIGVLLSFQVSNSVSMMMTENLTAQARAGAEETNAFLSKYFGAVDALCQSRVAIGVATDQIKTTIDEAADFPSLLTELRSMQQEYQDSVLNVFYADVHTGELVYQDNSRVTTADVDFNTREWYTNPRDRQQTSITSAYVDTGTQQMVVTISGPIMANGQMVGVMGIDVSLDELNESLSAIVIGNTGYITLIDSSKMILSHPDNAVVGTYVEDAQYSQNMKEALLSNQDVAGMAYTRQGNPYYGSAVYMSDLGYEVLGVLPAAEFDGHISSTVGMVVIGFVACTILVAAIVALLAISIARPLKVLTKVAERLADGELDVDYEAKGHDEVAQLGKSTTRIVDRLKVYIQYIDEISAVLDQMSHGDLVFQLTHDYKGEFARLKDALLRIQRNMSDTLSSIAQSAIQVNMGAEQIASGAQALAQGATEQASSVQTLSDTVQELDEKVSHGAEQAGQVIDRLNEVKDQVGVSNGQMQDMLVAMGDISRHSSDIGKIIKTIDDIAFQTNILALNAAVEAARAGEAGKGFAVVADEVRSLAGKSAAAAKETNDLIARSVEAVKRGEEIARSTAQTLGNAASSADEVVSAVEKVTRDYQDQAAHLKDISTGVDQISTVVQTNSATAEESAAASEELAGQASSMRQQIAMFHLSESEDSAPTDYGQASVYSGAGSFEGEAQKY